MRILKLARTTVTALAITAGIAACAGDPLAPNSDDDDPPPTSCVWLNGVIHCSES